MAGPSTITTPLKRKLDTSDGIPSEDWLTRAVRRYSPASKVIQSWNLGYMNFISIVGSMENGARIHIREFTEDAKGQQFPTKKGVTMTLGTWYHLTERIFAFNMIKVKSSFIANNQLLVMSHDGACILQQIFKDGDEKYFLKPCSLKLLSDQVCKLREHICDINDVVLEFQFQTLLPQLASKAKGAQCHFHTHICDDLEAMDNLIRCVYSELYKVVNNQLDCEGCVLDDPSQFNHLCMTLTISDKYYRASSDCFSLINLRKAVENLTKHYCLCMYNLDFFKDKNVSFYRKELEKLISSGKDPLFIS